MRGVAAFTAAFFFGGLVLAQGCPAVAVVIPETVIIERIPRPIPDPAAETAIIKHFLEYGMKVVDLVHVRLSRASPEGIREVERQAQRAMAGDMVAIRALAARDGRAAEVLVVGEAVATVTVFEALRIPGQPRLQDARARVELRAIEVATGRILAAEAFHTGGLDFSAELAGKKALERAGDRVACVLARTIAQRYPFPSGCFRTCAVPPATVGVLSFENRGGAPRGANLPELLVTATETALSERGCKTARAMAADFVVEGTITDWKEIVTPTIDLPILNLLFRGVVVLVTVDVRVLNVATAEFQAFEVKANVSGMEILGIRFGASPRDIARQVAQQIAARVAPRCRGS